MVEAAGHGGRYSSVYCRARRRIEGKGVTGTAAPCMTAWYRLWSFLIRLLGPGSWKEHLRSGGRWSRGDENSTGPAMECGDASHVGQNCPVPATNFASGWM